MSITNADAVEEGKPTSTQHTRTMKLKSMREGFSRLLKAVLTNEQPGRSKTDYAKLWDSDYVIEKGPEILGVQYYYHKDVMQTPCQRYLYLSNYLQEYEMRFDREYLLQEIEARETAEKEIEDLFTVKSGGINLAKVLKKIEGLRKLTLQAKERLELIIEPDVIYKIASVVLFDIHENPGFYDAKHGIEKVQKWRDGNVTDFFLTMPLQKLLNLRNLSQEDLKTYLKVAGEVKKEHLANIFTMLSSSQTKEDLIHS